MKIQIGGMAIGTGEPIAIQSMTNTKTQDVKSTLYQIHQLEEAGADLIRCSVPDRESALALKEIKKKMRVPLVADIHFDYRLGVLSVENGADKIRINPGNIGGEDRVKKVIEACQSRKVPIRIGVNSGSLPRHLLQKYHHPTPEALVEAAKIHIELVNRFDFDQLVISLKSSDTRLTVDTYRLFQKQFDYPLHLGITEAGPSYQGIVKSAVGIGALLLDGIGATLRVSLTDHPVEEIRAAKAILKAVGLGPPSVEVISCPTCARTQIDLIPIANQINEAVKDIKKPLKIAVMGCVVNGPGEAREADLGIAGGEGRGVLFRKGEVIRTLSEDQIVKVLLEEIEKL